jgi:hypothetical protein
MYWMTGLFKNLNNYSSEVSHIKVQFESSQGHFSLHSIIHHVQLSFDVYLMINNLHIN